MPQLCPLLGKPPYVCNGCEKLKFCTLEKPSIMLSPHSEKTNLLTFFAAANTDKRIESQILLYLPLKQACIR